MICVFILIGAIVLVNGSAFFNRSIATRFCCWHTLYFITISFVSRNIQSADFIEIAFLNIKRADKSVIFSQICRLCVLYAYGSLLLLLFDNYYFHILCVNQTFLLAFRTVEWKVFLIQYQPVSVTLSYFHKQGNVPILYVPCWTSF